MSDDVDEPEITYPLPDAYDEMHEHERGMRLDSHDKQEHVLACLARSDIHLGSEDMNWRSHIRLCSVTAEP